MSKRFDQSGGREAVLPEIPNCDLCASTSVLENRKETLAAYDGATTMGPWAYMCESHFQQFGIGLGEGRGQKLFTEDTA